MAMAVVWTLLSIEDSASLVVGSAASRRAMTRRLVVGFEWVGMADFMISPSGFFSVAFGNRDGQSVDADAGWIKLPIGCDHCIRVRHTQRLEI